MYELCGYGAVRGGEGEGRIVPGRVSGRCTLCDLPSVLGGAGSEVPSGEGSTAAVWESVCCYPGFRF